MSITFNSGTLKDEKANEEKTLEYFNFCYYYILLFQMIFSKSMTKCQGKNISCLRQILSKFKTKFIFQGRPGSEICYSYPIFIHIIPNLPKISQCQSPANNLDLRFCRVLNKACSLSLKYFWDFWFQDPDVTIGKSGCWFLTQKLKISFIGDS